MPVLPTASVYEVARVQTLLVSEVSAVGVKVAAQVLPLVMAITAREPLVQVTSSALAKPATVSEKTMVKVAVSPSIRVVSDMVILLADGARVSTT